VKGALSFLLLFLGAALFGQDLTAAQWESLTSSTPQVGWDQYQIIYLGSEPGGVTLDTVFPGTNLRANKIPGAAVQGGTSFLINYRGQPPEFSFNVPGKGNEPRLRKNWYSSTLPAIYVQEGILWPFDPRESKPTDIFTVLTINLHTYQEQSPEVKLERVGALLREAKVDAVFFQEMAQNKASEVVNRDLGLKSDHMIFGILQGMGYQGPLEGSFLWDWAHYGWGEWEEGLGLFTPGRQLEGRSYWVSEEENKASIDSRMVIKGEILWHDQPLLLASTHLSFSSSRDYQLEKLSQLFSGDGPFILGGDFNLDRRNSSDYSLFTQNYPWADTGSELGIYPYQSEAGTTPSGAAIDYILWGGDALRPLTYQTFFNGDSRKNPKQALVSDHYAVLVHFISRK
jgi:endonuclease/exonuclease/phosphatase family metal-dependent hydrolase